MEKKVRYSNNYSLWLSTLDEPKKVLKFMYFDKNDQDNIKYGEIIYDSEGQFMLSPSYKEQEPAFSYTKIASENIIVSILRNMNAFIEIRTNN